MKQWLHHVFLCVIEKKKRVLCRLILFLFTRKTSGIKSHNHIVFCNEKYYILFLSSMVMIFPSTFIAPTSTSSDMQRSNENF